MPKKGFTQSRAHRLKISRALKGRVFSEDHCENLRKSSFWKGRPRKKSFKMLSS